MHSLKVIVIARRSFFRSFILCGDVLIAINELMRMSRMKKEIAINKNYMKTVVENIQRYSYCTTKKCMHEMVIICTDFKQNKEKLNKAK